MSLSSLQKINEGVYTSKDSIVKIGKEEVNFVKRCALTNDRKRARICIHKTSEALLHEMIIAVLPDSYIHPHKHIGKTESFHIIYGEVDVVILDDYGDIVEVIEAGSQLKNKTIFFKIQEGVFHTLLIKSDFLVMHEVTKGPFSRKDTILAEWAPTENLEEDSKVYMKYIANCVAEYKKIY